MENKKIKCSICDWISKKEKKINNYNWFEDINKLLSLGVLELYRKKHKCKLVKKNGR